MTQSGQMTDLPEMTPPAQMNELPQITQSVPMTQLPQMSHCIGKCSVGAHEKTIENVQENKVYTIVFVEQENNRQKSCFYGNSLLIILWENAAFAHSGKLGNNVQENKLYSSVFVEQENNRQKSCFHGIHC